MILIFSTNTNRESVAYRSFNFTSFKLEVSEKLPQGLTTTNLSVPGSVPPHCQVRQYQSAVSGIVIVGWSGSQLNDNALATHLDAGKSLEP